MSTDDSGGKNGNGRKGLWGSLVDTAGKVPPFFLGVLLLNAVFVVSIIWLFARQSDSRERVLAPLIAKCAESVPMEVFRMMQQTPYHHGE